MSKNKKDSEPPPKKAEEIEGYEEPEDWDLPPVITEEDDSPEILEVIEPEEALGTIFSNIHISTIISAILGILFGIAFIVLERVISADNSTTLIIKMAVGFAAGIFLVFGASEIIILGVKGLSDKLNWNPYIEGLLQAIGAAIAELVVVIILLVNSYNTRKIGTPIAIAEADNLATTAIVLILTTVIINVFFLGIAMIFVARKNPFDLPHELTFYEANLILGMMVFSFVMMLFGLYFEFTSGQSVTTYNRYFEIVIGIALIMVYIFFVVILITRFGKRTSTPQTLMTEFLPAEDDLVVIEPATPTPLIELRTTGDKPTKSKKKKDKDKEREVEENNNSRRTKRSQKSHQERGDALATLRRFPWIIIIALFLIGAGGIVWGGEILASSIEHGIERFHTNVLVYAVVVGIVASSPELVVTLRGLLSKDKEKEEVGLVHQVSAINQTFFILFGVPFVLSGIIEIGIPISMDITVVMGGIFIMSVALILMIADDNKFDLLEGIVITILSIVSLLALALIGGITGQSESTSTAIQLAHIARIL